VRGGEVLANKLLLILAIAPDKKIATTARVAISKETPMLNLNHIKITPRDEQVLQLLMQGCSNKEIAAQLNISPRTVKQHLRTLFLRAGIRDGRKRVKLATAMLAKEQMKSCNPVNG
jgi:DNA-binding NarL/FixJ family response regulator